MTRVLGLLETTGFTPAMVAIDLMAKSGDVRVLEVELNDLYGVCVKIAGPTADVQNAIAVGHEIAEQMKGRPISRVLTGVAPSSASAMRSPPEFNPLLEQVVVLTGEPLVSSEIYPLENPTVSEFMNEKTPIALGFIETQGFTAVFQAIDTACKAASVEVVGKEKLGGGYV